MARAVTVPADAVLLIDLENMVGANARPGALAAKVDALTARAGSGVPAVAACAGNRITPAGRQVLDDRKIRLLTVSGDKGRRRQGAARRGRETGPPRLHPVRRRVP
jgi:hypothetical protein